jgi:hypothetical protein
MILGAQICCNGIEILSLHRFKGKLCSGPHDNGYCFRRNGIGCLNQRNIADLQVAGMLDSLNS